MFQKILISKNRFLLFLTLILLFGSPWTTPSGITAADNNELILKLKARIRQNPGDNSARLKLAGIYYDLAGSQHHFAVKSLLWTEPLAKRAGFTKNLPQILPQPLAACQQLLLEILDRDADNRAALVMAGNYHLLMNQREIGLWYFKRALRDNPDSLEINMALADYYLEEWQPAEALKMLNRFNSPEACLRKGAALIQSGEYHWALEQLLKAKPLPPLLETVRDLNLLKIYLILKDYQNFDSLIQLKQLSNKTDSTQIIAVTLLNELQGWNAFWKGDAGQAQNFWNQGGKLNPDNYWWNARWNLNSTRFASITTPAAGLAACKDNNLIQAVSLVLGAREYMGTGDLDSANQSLTAAIKSDPSSLVGLLAAGNLQLQRNNHDQALKYYNQGLKVNPKFIPILKKRAEIFQYSGNLADAGRDREIIKMLSIAGINSDAKLQFVPVWKEETGTTVAIRGNTRNLTGIWFSPDGEEWEWLPWWGGPLYFESTITQCWLVPVGKELEGEAYFIANLRYDISQQLMKPQQIADDTKNRGPEPEVLKSDEKNGQNQEIADHDAELPQLSFIAEDSPSPGEAYICWRVDQPVNCRLEVLSNRGVWKQIPVTVDSNGVFSGSFPEQNIVFARVVLQSKAGKNLGFYPVTELNRRLSNDLSGWFIGNSVSGLVNGRNIEIRYAPSDNPAIGGNNQIQWSVSNDLAVWSPWNQGSAPVKWRLESGDGLKLVYVRYKSITATDDYQVGVIMVTMDATPPELEAVRFDLAEATNSLNQEMLIRFKFNEPVILKILIQQSRPLNRMINSGSTDYRPEVSSKIAIQKAPKSVDTLEITVADQAGNQSKYIFEVSPNGINPKK